MLTRLWFRSMAVCVIAVLLTLLCPPAAGAPGDPGEAGVAVGLANAPNLPMQDLGFNPDLAFYGQSDVETVNIPVVAGLRPISLSANVLAPVFVRGATLTVIQEDREITRVDLPLGGAPAPLVIPLAGVRMVDNAVTLIVRTHALALEGYCLDPTNPLRLTDVTVTFDGTEVAPTTVADFLPPVLRRLTIFVGARPSLGEVDAAVQLAASVAAHYGAQYPSIGLVALQDPAVPPPGSGQPFERQIVIAEGPDAGVSLQPNAGGVPVLVVSGPAESLTSQGRLITSGVARYALSSAAVAGPLRSAAQLPGNVTTIRKLGQPGVNSTALSPEIYIGLDQARLGRSAHNLRVHLMGSYTPLPDAIGGRLVATVGGETIDRWPLTAEGVVNRWIDVPDRLLRRHTALRVKLDIAGNTGRCGEFQPLTLTIDGESEVESIPASPPIPAGFQSMPQSLMPRVQIGIGDDIFADARRATLIVIGMQRQSPLPLDTVVVPLQQAIDSKDPAVLISPAGWHHPEVPLPVVAPHTVPMTINVEDDTGAPTTLTLKPALPFGSLQTVFDGRRSLLVATSNDAPEQLDELIRWLSLDNRRVSDLDGEAVISVPGHDPVTVVGPVVAAAPEVPRESKSWWFAGGVLAVFVGVTAGWLWRRRRRAAGG